MTNRLESLQSMRLFASLGVFLFHLWNNYLGSPFIHPGTDFFILMVGVTTAVSQSPNIPTGSWGMYIRKRYLRLYVTFIPIFVLFLLAGSTPLNLSFNIKSFFFIPINNHLPLVPQTWMISNFLMFYWLFSVAFVFRTEKVLIPIFIIWAAGCIYYALANEKSIHYPEIYRVVFDIRNLEFLFGYVAGKIIYARRLSVKTSGHMLMIGVIVLGVSTIYYNNVAHQMNGMAHALMYGPSLFLIIIGIATLEQQQSKNLLLRCILHPWLVWMGNISYVLFLIHGIQLRVWNTVIVAITPIQVPILVIGVLISSALIYQFWEKPVLRYLQEKTHTLNKSKQPKTLQEIDLKLA